MRVLFLIVGSSLFLFFQGFAQDGKARPMQGSMASMQFAGSTGLLTAGYGRVSNNEKFELSLAYGYLPRSLGGQFHSISFKSGFNPFKIPIHSSLKGWQLEPLIAGAFLSQNFGDNLGLTWDQQYPPRYYWWTRSLRTHVFLGTQISWSPEDSGRDRFAFYFEANTNDLYISSYTRNTAALSLYDIVFLGMGLKVYW